MCTREIFIKRSCLTRSFIEENLAFQKEDFAKVRRVFIYLASQKFHLCNFRD